PRPPVARSNSSTTAACRPPLTPPWQGGAGGVGRPTTTLATGRPPLQTPSRTRTRDARARKSGDGTNPMEHWATYEGCADAVPRGSVGPVLDRAKTLTSEDACQCRPIPDPEG